MSDPRMIPADEAKQLIEQLDTELDAVASHSLAQGRKTRAQAAQIERVREVLAWAEQAENRAHADWIATADTHHRDAALAYTQAVTWLRYALGDTDEWPADDVEA